MRRRRDFLVNLLLLAIYILCDALATLTRQPILAYAKHSRSGGHRSINHSRGGSTVLRTTAASLGKLGISRFGGKRPFRAGNDVHR